MAILKEQCDKFIYKKDPNHPIMVYCAGLCFSTDRKRVALIHKLKPEYLANKLNGIGGKIEEGETISQGMEREFLEEAGAHIPADQWRPFARLSGSDFYIYFFVTFQDVEVKSMEAEQVAWYPVNEIINDHHIIAPNVRWLIPLGLDKNNLESFVYLPNECR